MGCLGVGGFWGVQYVLIFSVGCATASFSCFFVSLFGVVWIT